MNIKRKLTVVMLAGFIVHSAYSMDTVSNWYRNAREAVGFSIPEPVKTYSGTAFKIVGGTSSVLFTAAKYGAVILAHPEITIPVTWAIGATGLYLNDQRQRSRHNAVLSRLTMIDTTLLGHTKQLSDISGALQTISTTTLPAMTSKIDTGFSDLRKAMEAAKKARTDRAHVVDGKFVDLGKKIDTSMQAVSTALAKKLSVITESSRNSMLEEIYSYLGVYCKAPDNSPCFGFFPDGFDGLKTAKKFIGLKKMVADLEQKQLATLRAHFIGLQAHQSITVLTQIAALQKSVDKLLEDKNADSSSKNAQPLNFDVSNLDQFPMVGEQGWLESF